MRELTFVKSGKLEWRDRPDQVLNDPGDALFRPFVASRCDGDTLPIHRPVSRPMQLGLKAGLIDPVVASIVGRVPFQGPFGIGHEGVAQVTAVGSEVSSLAVGDTVVVPWAVSCGTCLECELGLTAKCSTMTAASPGRTLAAFGFGPTAGPWGGMVADSLRIPHADHMLVTVPDGVDPLRVAAASDNLADAWRAVVPPLTERLGGRVLVIGGGGQSIGLYAPGSQSRMAQPWSTTTTTGQPAWMSPRPWARGGTTSATASADRWMPCLATRTTSPWRPRHRALASRPRSERYDPEESAPARATTWPRAPSFRSWTCMPPAPP